MSIRATIGRRPLPVGLPTLVQVQEFASQAEAAASEAAVEAVAAAQPALDAARQGAEAAQAAVEAAVPNVEAARDAAVGYETRAEAAASHVPAVVKTLRLGALAYRRDPAGTALTTADGQNWLPEGAISPLHFGAVGDGVTDDTLPIRAAVAYAAALQPTITPLIMVDLMERRYAISGTILLTNTVVLVKGHLQATADFPVGQYMVDTTSNARLAGMRDMTLHGARRANIVRGNAQGLVLDRVRGTHFPNYGVRALRVALIDNCSFNEWDWSDPERLVWANRTAVGISIEHADGHVVGTNSSICRLPFYCNAVNTRVINSHFWNGGAPDMPVDADCAHLDNTEANILVGNYFDNGRLRISGKFGHTLSGNMFVKNTDGYHDTPIYIETAATGETVSGLVVTGNTFIGQFPGGLIQFGGTGTYVSDETKLLDWISNQRTGPGSNWLDHKSKNKLSLSGSSANFGYTFDGYYNLNFHSGARIRAANIDSAATNITLAFGDADRHRFSPNQYTFGLGQSSSGSALMQIMADGVNGVSLHPSNAAGTIDYNASLNWTPTQAAWRFKAGRVDLGAVPSQIYSEIRADRALRFEADWDANHTANRYVDFVFAGTHRHRISNAAYDLGIGYGAGGTGAAVRMEAATGGIARLSPSDGAGAYDATKSFEWDGTRWRFRGGRLSMHGLPASATGLAAGDVWVDTAAGNVLKVV